MKTLLLKPLRPLLILATTFAITHAEAQNRIGTGKVDELYQTNCAACHGAKMEGGLGSSLIDDEWLHGDSDDAIAKSIREGFPELGMVPWAETLDDQQIRSLVILIREQTQLSKASDVLARTLPKDGIFKTNHHDFTLEEIYTGDALLWSLAFLPDGRKLVTQRDGKLLILEDGKDPIVIKKTPEVWQRGQGGLLEVALHPEYQENGWIYLSYTENTGGEENGKAAGMTAIIRGKIDGACWTEQEELFHVPSHHHTNTGAHFGSRFVFQNGYLFFSIGDRGRQSMAQDLTRPNGKIHRIHDDGRIPTDNPFVDVPDAYPSIWSYGHRNPQGLDLDPSTGLLWACEHGPRGGDETNLIEAGKNYGWPLITYGMNYNGSPMTDKTHQEGLEQPKHYWTPSIAVCGIDFYEGHNFPQWKNNLFVTGLSAQELQRLVIKDNQVVETEIVLKNQGRARDVLSAPDGHLYIILNEKTPVSGRICKLVPAPN